jgi:hypothetical protein
VQHSDTDLAELNMGLLLEERGLVANRGLVTAYQDDPSLNDVQTFAIHVPEELRQRCAPPRRSRPAARGWGPVPACAQPPPARRRRARPH